jgi:hypothetical protein
MMKRVHRPCEGKGNDMPDPIILQYAIETTPTAAQQASNEAALALAQALNGNVLHHHRSPRFAALSLANNLRSMAAALEAGALPSDLILRLDRVRALGLHVQE